MAAYRTVLKLSEEGAIALPSIPFHAGQTVEVIIREAPEDDTAAGVTPLDYRALQGLPLTYVDPFGPAVPPEDWEALR